MATPKTLSLLDVVQKVTASDLAEIDQQIAAKKDELAEQSKRLVAELASLKALRKVVDLRVNGKPARKPRQPRPAAGGGTPMAAALRTSNSWSTRLPKC